MPSGPFLNKLVCFGEFEADLQSGRLFKRGVKLKLRGQSFQVLAALLYYPGQIVTREELKQRLWPDGVFVDFENSLNTAVGRLREALDDSAQHPRFIETLPRRGYRFLADVFEPPSTPEKPRARGARLVVLPFLNLSGDPAQEYFSDAMTDEIITELASLAPDQLAVIARTTAMRFKGSRKDPPRIARELGADYVVEGALRYTENHVDVNVHLIQASDQTHLFARRYKAELSDIFRTQSSIAQGIASHIPSIAGIVGQEQVAKKPTENVEAYNEYIKGRYEMWKWTPESVAKAKQHFEAALAHDPRFALPYDSLANLYWYLGFWGFLPPDETEPLRRFYGMRAFELGSNLAEPRSLVAYVPEKCRFEDSYSYNWAEYEKQMARARDLNPNSPPVRVRYASVLMVLGRLVEAHAELECALEADPLSFEVQFWLAEAYFLGRQYEKALARCQQLVELEPEHYLVYIALGTIYLGMERFEESISALRRAAELSGSFPLVLGWLGLALGLGGRTGEARTVLERIVEIAERRFVLPTTFAWIHLGLGNIAEAFAWMEQAVDRHDGWIHVLKSYPFLDSLRTDPRLEALMCKLNLDP